MTPEVIQFHCPACQSLLTVPVQLAGVSGPCPKCGQTVTSPPATAMPAPAPVPAAFAPPSPPVAPPTLSVPEVLPSAPPAGLPAFPPAPAWANPPAPAAGPSTFPQHQTTPLETSLPPRKPQAVPPASSLLDAALTSRPPPAPTATSPTSGQVLPSLGGDASSQPTLPALGGLLNQSFDKPSTEVSATSGSVLANVLPSRKPTPNAELGTGVNDPSASPAGSPKSRQPLPPFPNRPSKGSSFARFFIALVMLLGALALLGFFFASPLKQLYYQHIAPRLDLSEDPDVVIADPLTTDLEGSSPLVSSILGSQNDSPIPDPDASPPTAAPPEVIEKAKPADPEETALPKIEPLKPDGLMEVPQDPSAQEIPSSVNLASPPSFATAIPEEAQPAADALIAFLAAESVEEKRQFILGSDDPQVASLITRYYGANSASAIPVTTIGFIRHDPNPEVGGGMQTVFMVASPEWKHPIPVMLQETQSGIKLDWIAFTEFKDDWLYKFVETFRSDPARFHVSIRRGHYFDKDVPDLENKHCFFIQPPQEHFEVAVFVPKNTPLADMLGRELSWGTQNAYVLAEIQWRNDGQFKWVELTAVPQLNWHITIEPPAAAKSK